VTRSNGWKKTLFKDLIADTDDEKNLIIYRGDYCIIILNRFPYSSGHCMVLPKRQVSDLEKLSSDESQELILLAQKCVTVLRKAYRPDGFNIGLNLGSAAGAGIAEHLHMHVVPRWSGDTNFITTTGETRVVPENLSDTYHKLKQLFFDS